MCSPSAVYYWMCSYGQWGSAIQVCCRASPHITIIFWYCIRVKPFTPEDLSSYVAKLIVFICVYCRLASWQIWTWSGRWNTRSQRHYIRGIFPHSSHRTHTRSTWVMLDYVNFRHPLLIAFCLAQPYTIRNNFILTQFSQISIQILYYETLNVIISAKSAYPKNRLLPFNSSTAKIFF